MKAIGSIAGICFLACTLMSCSRGDRTTWIAEAPAGNRYTAIDRDGVTVLPNGRLLTPRGLQIQVAPHPYGLVLSPDGTIAVTANSGVRPFSVSIIRGLFSTTPNVDQIPKGYYTDKGILASVYMGLAVSPDNTLLFVAGGQEGEIYVFRVNDGSKVATIDCNVPHKGVPYADSYIGDLVLSADGSRLYVLDQFNFRMIVIDPVGKAIVASVAVGRYPFGIALSPDGKMAYVANVGMFAYQPVKSYDSKNPEATALERPAFGYLSREAKDGIHNDTLEIPGLGDPNVPESFSVWAIDIEDASNPLVTAKTKTGFLVGEVIEGIPAVGGASPNSVVATDRFVFASNGNNDCISVIDRTTSQVTKNIPLEIDSRLKHLRGVIPYGLALAPDGKRLYVAESGINAVGVIDVTTLRVVGHIPVGWFPSKLRVSNDGRKLVVANAKGYGSGPNGGPAADRDPRGTYVGNLMNGTVSVLDIPTDSQLEDETRRVVDNNFSFLEPASPGFAWRKKNPVPLFAGAKESPIHHIVYIAKENRTYDEVFGQVSGGRGDSALARFGAGRTLTDTRGTKLGGVTIMPNHLQLAGRFCIADNFYCDSDVSADGHRWLVGTYPNEWVETNVPASYGGGRDTKRISPAPGKLAATGTSGAIYPEDYNEAGSLWEHLERGKIDFFNFGLGLDQANSIEDLAFKHTGERFTVNYPVPAPMLSRTSSAYPTWNMSIPDQFRADMFIKEFNARWMGKGKRMPQLITVYLPNDHGAGIRPDAGYPFAQSYQMDNDLALGRIVDFLSHTPYWRNMAIVVTEDDPQGGVDHVDAHRSILMVISPYAKHNTVSHVHYSFGSIMKTFWHVLGLPYLNQYDTGVSDLADCFKDTADLTPYVVVPVESEVFNPEKALTPLDEKFDWSALFKTPVLDDPELMKEWSEEDSRQRKSFAALAFTPDIEPAGGLFMGEQTVRIKLVGPPAELRYTLDGSDPIPSSETYAGPITIRKATIVKARAFSSAGNGSRIKEARFDLATPVDPEHPRHVEPGLEYGYFEGTWQRLPDFARLRASQTGVAPDIEIQKIKAREDRWGIAYTGYLRISVNGVYTFYLNSDDGSRLYVGGKEVVNNDGTHAAKEASGEVALAAGLHRIRLVYFEDVEGEELTLSFKAPGMPKQKIPATLYVH